MPQYWRAYLSTTTDRPSCLEPFRGAHFLCRHRNMDDQQSRLAIAAPLPPCHAATMFRRLMSATCPGSHGLQGYGGSDRVTEPVRISIPCANVHPFQGEGCTTAVSKTHAGVMPPAGVVCLRFL